MIRTGTIIGNRYRIAGLLGGGGMKLVYLVEDLRLARRRCSLAEFIYTQAGRSGDAATLARFEREAQILAELSNLRIPHVYDSPRSQGIGLSLGASTSAATSPVRPVAPDQAATRQRRNEDLKWRFQLLLGGFTLVFFGSAILGGFASIGNHDDKIGAAIWFLMEGVVCLWLLRRITEDIVRTYRSWVWLSVCAFLLSFLLLGCAVFLVPLEIGPLLGFAVPAAAFMLVMRAIARRPAPQSNFQPQLIEKMP